MKRRDFVKTAACAGCAGALCAGIPLCKKIDTSDIKTKLAMRKFLYKSEKELPTRIRIDICNLCQLNCAACWMRRDEELIKKIGGGFGYVPFETFKNFVDRHPFVTDIELSKGGEIFLNPELDDIIEYAYKKGVSLSAFNGVNLNRLSEKTAENLVKFKFKGMHISIDGTTPESYAIYRRGGDFNTVISNIKMINKFKEKYNSEFPHMTYKFIVFGHNEHEIDDVPKIASSLNMDYKYDLNTQDFSPVKNPQMVYEKTGLVYFKNNEIMNDILNPYYKYIKDRNNWFYCKDMFTSPTFNWNGNFFGCDANSIAHFDTDVFRDGMLKTLNSEKVLYAKLMLSDMSVEPQDGIPCSGCRIYNVLKEKNCSITV